MMSEPFVFPWVIELQIPKTTVGLKLRVRNRATVGRTERALGIIPDLDLTPYGAAELDIAPEHIAIFVDDHSLNVVDLGSGKPTLLNGIRLEPEEAHLLEHKDELQLGALRFQVRIIATPDKGSVVHRQPDLQLPDVPVGGKGQRVLIVEDDPETAEVFKLALERAGFSTHVCREVVSAIRALATESPCLIVLDLMLPDVHGLELCRYVRRDIEQRDIPIVVVSALPTAANITHAMEAGANFFLGKPVSLRELEQAVSALIHWHEMQKPLSLQTKQLNGSAALEAIPTDVRRDALVLFVAGHQEPIAVVVPKRITIGRRSGNTAPRPHVDLDRYGAFDAGVSRMHAAIHRKDDGFYIEDLGSSNGTWINETLLPPNEQFLLHNASEIRLGNLRLRAFFIED